MKIAHKYICRNCGKATNEYHVFEKERCCLFPDIIPEWQYLYDNIKPDSHYED